QPAPQEPAPQEPAPPEPAPPEPAAEAPVGEEPSAEAPADEEQTAAEPANQDGAVEDGAVEVDPIEESAEDRQAAEGPSPVPAAADPLPWWKSKRKSPKGLDNRRKPRQPRPRRQPGLQVPHPGVETDRQPIGGPGNPPAAQPAPAAASSDQPRILDLLDGVTLPFDLTPLTARIADPETHIILISPHGDAAEVGTAFADELVEQGFAIEPAGFDQALAVRAGETLSMRISPEAGTITEGGQLRYPSVNDTDVAIEVWLGNGSPPALAD
ncbi:MAG: hypothetical protein AAF531_28030, partial [Actinomycetota bacterium]